MEKLTMAWGRGILWAALLASLSACNYDESSSVQTGPQAPPTSGDPPNALNPPPSSPAPSQPSGNVAPQIVGNPTGEVLVGQSYSFMPNASDADGDNLTFSIASKPGWAAFNSTTGRLSGTPGAGDVGSYEEIVISVSDGETTRALPQFAINVVQQSSGSVTLAWQPPTENTDGTPLVNLTGYKIHYGTDSGDYDSTVEIGSGVTRHVIENLTEGTWYFAITAVSGNGAESDFSGEASKTI